MVNILIKPDWQLKEAEATPESHYLNRKTFLKSMGLGLASALVLGCDKKTSQPSKKARHPSKLYDAKFAPSKFPAKRNRSFDKVPGRDITSEVLSTSYNNYYEFTQVKEEVWSLAANFVTNPWKIKVSGLSHKPREYDLEDLVRRFPLEERVYRFRCVEAWAMVVPWVGIPLSQIISFLKPLSKARYVRFVGWYRPEQAKGQKEISSYTWPYYEALRMDEAMNPLTMFTVGMYGHPLTKQNGAPVRLIVPWKYGYKSMKGITEIEFLEKKPGTFWNDAVPSEYGFYSNVNPRVPHPRWSQASERVLGFGREERIATLPYNGYGKYVAKLYNGREV